MHLLRIGVVSLSFVSLSLRPLASSAKIIGEGMFFIVKDSLGRNGFHVAYRVGKRFTTKLSIRGG
jgi:hypothetical protein